MDKAVSANDKTVPLAPMAMSDGVGSRRFYDNHTKCIADSGEDVMIDA